MSHKFDPAAVIERFKVTGSVLGVAGTMLTCGIGIGVLTTSYRYLEIEIKEQRRDFQREIDNLKADMESSKDDMQRELDEMKSKYKSNTVRMNSHQIDINVLKQRIND